MSPVSSTLRPRAGDADHARHRVRLAGCARSRRPAACRTANSTPSQVQRWPGLAARRRAAPAPPADARPRASSSARRTGSAPSTARAPPTWSMSRWLSTSRSTRGVAARAQQRHEHALAGIAVARVLRPGVEQQDVGAGADQHRRALADVGDEQGRTSPVGRQRRAAAAAAASTSGSGEQPGAPGQRQHRQGAPRAARRPAPRAAPPAPTRRRPAAPRAGPARHRAPAPRLRRAATAATPARRAAPAASPAASPPESRPGWRAKPTSETCWKKTRVSGVSPSVATTWVRTTAHRPRRAHGASGRARAGAASAAAPVGRRPRRRRSHQQADGRERQPEARAAVSAHGSSSVTTLAAASSTSSQGQRTPAPCSRRHGREHPDRALRRHAPAGEHGIGSGRGEPAPARRGRRRQGQHRPAAAAPDGAERPGRRARRTSSRAGR